MPEEPGVALLRKDDGAVGIIPCDGHQGDLSPAEEGDLHLLQGFIHLVNLRNIV